MIDQAQKLLKSTFGYDEFRPLQAEVIQNVLNRLDTLVIMPTGGGKSICYQIPALIFEGLTVVVSPLISLMKDQVEQLLAVGVDAILLNSTLSSEEYANNIYRIKNRQASLLYVAPETLMKPGILDLLTSVQIDCLTVDEAHCISEWGHDFRPEYRQIARLRDQLPNTVFLALTATATPQVQDDICRNLHFENQNKFVASFNRDNLFIQVAAKNSPLNQAIDFLKKFPDQSGIIYCFSRRQVEALAAGLQEEGFSVRPYHAGLADEVRKENQELFIRDDVQIIVATIAFGMGINKSNVRFVLHYDLPKSIESYYQEIGRAGRDGVRSDCLLLFGYGDTQKIRYLIEQKEDAQQRKVASVHLDKVVDYAESDACRRKPLLNYFGESYDAETCGMCDNCLKEKEELVDITVAAQKFLSCVFRTGQYFGSAHIIDVLRGSTAQKIIQKRHHLVSTHGVGKEYSKQQWGHLSRQFIRKGFLKKDPTYGSLKLTGEAAPVLSGEEKVFGTLQDEPVKVTADKQVSKDFDRELFNLLRIRRKELADDAGVPPYVIFSDKSLQDMAAHFPQSQNSLLDMHGVGSAKMEKYGDVVLDIIRRYCGEKRIAEKPKGQKAAPRKKTLKDPTHKPRYVIVAESYNSGNSPQDIVSEFGIQLNTVLDHLYKYYQEGSKLRKSDDFLSVSDADAEIQEAVMQAFDRLGTQLLKPVFEAVNSAVSYDELKILRMHYFCRKTSL